MSESAGRAASTTRYRLFYERNDGQRILLLKKDAARLIGFYDARGRVIRKYVFHAAAQSSPQPQEHPTFTTDDGVLPRLMSLILSEDVDGFQPVTVDEGAHVTSHGGFTRDGDPVTYWYSATSGELVDVFLPTPRGVVNFHSLETTQVARHKRFINCWLLRPRLWRYRLVKADFETAVSDAEFVVAAT